jgi:cytochrome b subunit of formate dehydrogenase
MTTKTDTVVRFSLRTRIEHVSVMGLFLALAVTGFPQKFYPAPGTRWLVDALGGIDAVRWLHRASGVSFAVLFVVHVVGAIWPTLRQKAALTLVPDAKDFRDAAATLRYQLGAAPKPPAFDRFDYRQKFEYWGLLLGGSVMVATGFLLLFPLLATAVLGGQFVPAAKVAHSNEGLMAFLVVLTWHIFNAHLSPEAFPGDTTIFTGRIEKDRLRHEHPLEYARLAAGTAPPSLAGPPVWALLTAPVRGALLVMYLPSLGFVMVGLHLGRRLRAALGRLRRAPKSADEAKAGEPPASAA